MAKCANCELEAKYQYDVAPSYAILYCFKHVPKFLATQIAQGSLEIKAPESEPEPVVSKPSKKKTTVEVVEEPVVEEPVVEETIDEEAVVDEDVIN
jgi:hypothetical protein